LVNKVIVIALVSVLLLSLICGLLFVNLVTAKIIPPVILPEITIKSDGSISPQTEHISRNGNTYTLIAYIQDLPIVIERSNIVFDGAGNTINITSGDNTGLYVRDIGKGRPINNVTIKNVNVFTSNIYTVYLHNSHNCEITSVQTNGGIRIAGDSNQITESDTKIYIFSGGNNLITKNNISDVLVDSSSNKFFKNNFYLDSFPKLFAENLWDNGFVGNYWSNYTLKYPDASEVNNSGVGDTPYVIDQNNIDHYPLIYPYNIEKDEIVKSTQEPKTPSLLTPIIAGISIVTAIGITSTIFYSLKHRKQV
jgi:hypothetical protein